MFRRGRERERRGTPADLLVVGMGNPGEEYAGSRHNLGAEVVALLAERHGGRLRRAKERAQTDEVRFAERLVALVVPTTYYNEAGVAVAALARRHGVEEPERVVVVHDELDLPVGTVRVKVGGGLAGNNGLKSIKAHLHSDAFCRVRIGVGKPPGRMQGVDHVLRRPGKAERAEFDVAVQEAADAVEALATEGPAAAMTRFNQRA